jgi:hypothetical protein
MLYASKWDSIILVLFDGHKWAYIPKQQSQVTKSPLSTKAAVNSNSSHTHLDTVYTFTVFIARTWQQNKFYWWQAETWEFLCGYKIQRLPITMYTKRSVSIPHVTTAVTHSSAWFLALKRKTLYKILFFEISLNFGLMGCDILKSCKGYKNFAENYLDSQDRGRSFFKKYCYLPVYTAAHIKIS